MYKRQTNDIRQVQTSGIQADLDLAQGLHRGEGANGLAARKAIIHNRICLLYTSMLAIGHRTDSGIDVRVHPAMIPASHPLAGVSGAMNAMKAEGCLLYTSVDILSPPVRTSDDDVGTRLASTGDIRREIRPV